MPRRGPSETPADARRARVIQLALISAGLASGLIAVTLGAEWNDPVVWASDLIVGLVFFTVAALLWTTARTAAVLAVAVGVTWYLGSFLPLAQYWHRGPLIHLILLAPLYRPGRWPRRGILLAAYAVSAVPLIWSDDVLALALSLALGVIAWVPGIHTTRRRGVLLSRWSLTVLAVGIVLGAAIPAFVPHHDGAHAALLQYEAALVVVALLQVLARRSASTAILTDLVVELEESRSDALSVALGRALGDATVRVGYWDSETGDYRDVRGQPVDPPPPGSDSAGTEIRRDDDRFAVVIHEVSLEDDPRLMAAISSATDLTSANAGLQAVTRARVAEVEASRTRLVLAADAELRDLARTLDAVIANPLRGLLGRIDARLPAAGPEAAQTFSASRGQLVDVLGILDATALGLPPRELDAGLGSALAMLAARCPLPVTLDADDRRFLPEVESALYLCAAEAVTNSVKHSAARTITITLKVADDHAVLSVADDGSGAVNVEAGTGITGITDRIAALGGRLHVEGTPGSGTLISAGIPLA